ncbi:MAG: flagellar biosynthesis protein FlhF [Phycisphaerales bacterium]|nr:flagellar biosynthesis protein FlhF [Phycisphaerales bacterium]
MTIKTFRAETVGEALAQVKRDLGRDAVILHTRTYRAGGVMGVGAKTFTEITATSEFNPGRKTAPAAEAPGRERAAPAAAPGPRPLPPVEVAPPARPVRASRSPRSAAGSVSTPASEPRAGAVGPSVPEIATLESELRQIKRMVGSVLRQSHSRDAVHVGMPEALEAVYIRLMEAEVAAEIADGVVGAVRDELGAGGSGPEPEAVRAAVLRNVASLVPVDATAPAIGRAADGRPTTIALVGPTGVGKTTTIAKLAATYKLRMGKKVGLVTADTYRIAAAEQLRTYANIIGLPMNVALSPAEMAQAVASLASCDVVLIDTAGRSPSDGARLAELRRFLDAASPHQVHLVLSGTAGESALRAAADRFAAVRPDRLIFTKLDEAVGFGVLLNVLRRVGAKLSFVTTGQEVPDQIEPGNSERLARLILDGPGGLAPAGHEHAAAGAC